MSDLVLIDDTLPIQGCHFLIRRGRPQIKTTPLGASYLADAMTLGFAGIIVIKELIEMAAQDGQTWTNCHGLADLARRRMYSDVSRFLYWLTGIMVARGELDE